MIEWIMSSTTQPKNTPKSPPDHGRLWAEDRERQLLEVTMEILANQGVDGVRIPEVATAAGVTRPTVYKHFPNRQALLIGVLEDFGKTLEQRFRKALAGEKQSLEQALHGVLDAIFDTLEERGAGAWKLLISLGPDPEVERVVQEVRERLLRPWVARVTDFTGLSTRDARHLSQMLAATTAPVLGAWLDGDLPREQARAMMIRGNSALLREFSKESSH